MVKENYDPFLLILSSDHLIENEKNFKVMKIEKKLIKDLIEVQFNRSLLVDAGKLKNPAVKLFVRTTNQIISSLNEAIFTSNTETSLLASKFRL